VPAEKSEGERTGDWQVIEEMMMNELLVLLVRRTVRYSLTGETIPSSKRRGR
jgi:hypothetical protein